ncbi:hypothetical protein H5410_042048 [Solanum commersonii]|uniref:Uncharacterized protein n=1 Tax=Solanum commersonii TaxID=4109 RepID=A0A9J5XXC9_SOLCO|nr:hypothetical protein H5410_042048 [Solanum commersonii]
MRNLKKEKSWRLLGRTKTKGNKANKIPETCKCNTQIERMETPVHNTSSTKKEEENNNKPIDKEWQTQKRKAYRPVQHSMDRLKSPKETLQQQQTHHTSMTTNSALPTSNNFIDLSMQDQPNNQEGAENQNSKDKDTMETQINNKSTTDNMLGMRTLTEFFADIVIEHE